MSEDQTLVTIDDEKTILERIERCEQGLTAIETILRVTFPQFFEPEGGCDNGDQKTVSGIEERPGETGKETGSEKEGEETSEEKTQDSPQET